MHLHLPKSMHHGDESDSKPRGAEEGAEDSMRAVRDKFGVFLKENVAKGREKFNQALGLGQTPSVIPPGEVDISGEPRTVELGWHPVPGLGKWFAETGFGKSIGQSVHSCPDPTQHWALIVGDYCHQLWMDENLDVVYTNQKIHHHEWHTYEVGKSRFNDAALKQAGDMTIATMREKRPAYNLIDNNCQTFALKMLDSIQIGNHREFVTTYEVYQRAMGGKFKDLFVEGHPDEKANAANANVPAQGAVPLAQQVMDEKTPKLDSHDALGTQQNTTA